MVDERIPDDWKKHRCSTCNFFEDDSPPPDYPDPDAPPPETGYVTSPYIPVVSKTFVNGDPKLGEEMIERLKARGHVKRVKINPEFLGQVSIENLD